MFDIVREIAQTLRNNRLRTFLTGLSVVWGIFMLIILLGMSRGVYNAFDSNFKSQASNSLQVWGGNTEKPYRGHKEGRYIKLKDDDVMSVLESNTSQIKDVLPVINGTTVTVSTSRDYMTGYYEGVYPAYLTSQGLEVSHGRFINEADIREGRKVIVMSDRNAGQLFESSADAIGKNVSLNGLSFKVIGVYSARWQQQLFVPYTTARMLNGYSHDINQMVVEVKNVSSLSDGVNVEKAVRGQLAINHEFDSDDNSAVWIWNRFTQHITMANGLGILNTAIWIIGLFTLLSGIIGVSNIMFVSVKERTHEIGIRRAIGAKPRSILFQIILEGVSITAIFGYVGIVLGIGATELLNHIFADTEFLKNPTVSMAIAVQVTVVLVLAGLLAGLFPALRALKVKPVEALRTE